MIPAKHYICKENLIGNFIIELNKRKEIFFGQNEYNLFESLLIDICNENNFIFTINKPSLSVKQFVIDYSFWFESCPWVLNDKNNPCFKIKYSAKDNPECLYSEFRAPLNKDFLSLIEQTSDKYFSLYYTSNP